MYWSGLSVYYLWHSILVPEQTEPEKRKEQFDFTVQSLSLKSRHSLGALLLLLSDATDRDIMIE